MASYNPSRQPVFNSMRILMLAPEPFFQPRGTPFSEFYRIKAMTELGHEVDLVTYPIGEDVSMPGLRIFRTIGIPFVRSVKIGPSIIKVPLDALLFFAAFWRLVTGRYQLLDCHEEAGLMGVLLSRLFRVPTLYDMHSSLPEQLQNFRFSRSRLLRYLFERAEELTLVGSDAVIVICPNLAETVARVDPDKPCFLIENSPLAESSLAPPTAEARALRRSLGLDDAIVLLYTGTFESYQGLDLLYGALQRVRAVAARARLVMVGGTSEQVEAARRQVERMALDAFVAFVGQRPPEEMPLFLAAGDILVSPRSRGTNTPLKIYSYLRAGKPIVATRLLTHTQVLDDEIAQLTDPSEEAFAQGIVELIQAPDRGRRLAEAARRRSEERYSYAVYLERTRRALDFLSDLSTKSGNELHRRRNEPAATK